MQWFSESGGGRWSKAAAAPAPESTQIVACSNTKERPPIATLTQ